MQTLISIITLCIVLFYMLPAVLVYFFIKHEYKTVYKSSDPNYADILLTIVPVVNLFAVIVFIFIWIPRLYKTKFKKSYFSNKFFGIERRT